MSAVRHSRDSGAYQPPTIGPGELPMFNSDPGLQPGDY